MLEGRNRGVTLVMACLLWCGISLVHGQIDTSGLWVDMDSITVSATRLNKQWLKSSNSISQYSTENLHSQTQSFQEMITQIPGVFSLNATNLAQDLRISIRGFGARSAFGVRGVKVMIDGIPETTTDGQTQMDAIPLGMVENLEIIKGPSSTLYGNASGGVIQVNTFSGSNSNLGAKPLIKAKATYGAFNFKALDLVYGAAVGNTNIIGNLNQSSADGFRTQSNYLNRYAKLNVGHRFSNYADIKLYLDYFSSPEAGDSGGLTLTEVDSSRQQARPRNMEFKTGEIVDQFKASISYNYKAGEKKKFKVYGFYTDRDFKGYLPFERGGIVDLQRQYFGQGASYEMKGIKDNPAVRIKYGYDVSRQIDYRVRFSNLLGMQGAMDQEQIEKYNNVGLYVIGDADLNTALFNFGLRFDHHSITIEDEFFFDDFLNGNATGQRQHIVFNPSLGISFPVGYLTNVFGNFSTGFETPTLNEYTANPDGFSGLNDALAPQRSINLEIGLKTEVEKVLRAQVTLFHTSTKDELIRYSLDSLPERVLFRNAGSTRRTGLELEVLGNVNDDLTVIGNYSFSRFKYASFSDDTLSFDGNQLPGIPVHNFGLTLNYDHPLGVSISSSNRYVGGIYLNDENTVSEDGYFLSNLYLAYSVEVGDYKVQPFLGVNNLTDTKYFDNLRINSGLNRYYEPAPGIHLYGGIKFTN